MSGNERRLVVGITGASGSIYAVRFLRAALPHFDRIYLCPTESASLVLERELGIAADGLPDLIGGQSEKITVFSPRELTAPPSSGSVLHEGMVIIPCTVGTAGRIASGVSNDLVTRAADVCLKERRKLVLVVRETPLNLIHLRNLTTLAEAGATVLPASPAFYNHPKTVDDMVSFVVARAMQSLGIPQEMLGEWGIEDE